MQNAREGEDVAYTVCRDHNRDYRASGTRTIYVVPEGKEETDRVFVTSREIDKVIEGENCQSYIIEESEFHHKPGKYQLTLNISFEVGRSQKQIYVKSGIYSIYENPNSPDAQIEINNLRSQLRALQDQFNQLERESGTEETDFSSNPPEDRVQSNSPSNAGNPQPESPPAPAPQAPSNPSPETPATPDEEPLRIIGIPMCVPLTGICVTQ